MCTFVNDMNDGTIINKYGIHDYTVVKDEILRANC